MVSGMEDATGACRAPSWPTPLHQPSKISLHLLSNLANLPCRTRRLTRSALRSFAGAEMPATIDLVSYRQASCAPLECTTIT